MPKKKTIDQQIDALARMTQRGFIETNKQFGQTIEKLRREVRDDLHETESRLRQELVTKRELRETEEHLLDAIRGIEVRRQDFETLEGEVKDLSRRVTTLEKKR